MRIAHEAPLCIFDKVQEATDYDYALVHLYEENPEYLDKFTQAIEKGRHVILDNSVFELETAFDSDRFLYWINKTKPSEYIIPDVLEDSYSTLRNLGEWKALYEHRVTSGSKSIGVVQGRDYEDIVWCYQHMEPMVDKVAFSFDYSFMCPKSIDLMLRDYSFSLGRRILLQDLYRNNVINVMKPHHLLGCFLPQEFTAYKLYNWVDTIDTSSPVVAGINLEKYRDYGLDRKNKTKVIEYMNDKLTSDQEETIMYNIEKFRGFCV